MRIHLRLVAVFILPLLGLKAQAPDDRGPTRLLRFPATNGHAIVFSYAGQLYTVAADGGTARRLTDGPGYAIFPRFSADGTQLAFTAQYDGNTEVYVMPATGGTPKGIRGPELDVKPPRAKRACARVPSSDACGCGCSSA